MKNTDLSVKILQKIVEFKNFSRLLDDFPVLFKAYLIFKDLLRKHFSSLCEPCGPLMIHRSFTGLRDLFVMINFYLSKQCRPLYNIASMIFYVFWKIIKKKTICMLGNFSCFCCRLLTFKKKFRSTT